jgi:hypothetical protein
MMRKFYLLAGALLSVAAPSFAQEGDDNEEVVIVQPVEDTEDAALHKCGCGKGKK